MAPVCGIVLLDKPLGLSSNAALQRVRRAYSAVKAGHVGSLDPLATGMLPVCLGEATKVITDFVGGRKRYRFTVKLGARTSTGDAEGEVLETAPVPALDAARVESILPRFRGPQLQVPPMYSALKREGQPLYKLARAGIEVEREARVIELSALQLIEFGTDGILSFEALCSKGTYIRVLAEDIARALGSCGHVIALRRLSVEPFAEGSMQTLEVIESRNPPQPQPADSALMHLSAVELDSDAARRLQHGQVVPSSAGLPSGRVRVYAAGRFLGIGESDGQGSIQPRRLFVV